jgi:hypothetical protein
MKNKETLEKAAENHINNDLDLYESLVDGHISYNIGIDLLNNIFIEGAKWQAEKMYSEEDMRNAFDSAREFNSLDGVVDVHIVLPMGGDMSDLQPLHFTFKEWFEQFKK